MRRWLPLIMVVILSFPQVVMGAGDFSDSPGAALGRFFTAVAASARQEAMRPEIECEDSRGLIRAPSSQAASAAQSTVQKYFPMQNGDSKTYTSTAYSSAVYTYYQTTKNGNTAWREDDSVDGSQTYYGYSGDNLVMYGADTSDLSLSFDSALTILSASQIANGGTIQSQTTLQVQGIRLTVSYTGTVRALGSVTVPAGTFDDCIELSMTFSYTAEGESGSMDLGDVWVLAPDVGKTKVAIMDQYGSSHGWFVLDHGTAGGTDVASLVAFAPAGTLITDQLWIGTVIYTEDKGPIEGVWQLGGEDTTARGDRVIWGHFYADPAVMSWGSANNPDLFVKIWFDVTGPVYVDYFHVSVPDIEVYSSRSDTGGYEKQGTTVLLNRFVEHSY